MIDLSINWFPSNNMTCIHVHFIILNTSLESVHLLQRKSYLYVCKKVQKNMLNLYL